MRKHLTNLGVAVLVIVAVLSIVRTVQAGLELKVKEEMGKACADQGKGFAWSVESNLFGTTVTGSCK